MKKNFLDKVVVTMEQLNNFYNRCYVIHDNAQDVLNATNILMGMAKNDVNKLLSIWEEIAHTGMLQFPDFDDPLFYSINVGFTLLVYDKLYEVVRIGDGIVYFERR